MTNKSTSDFLRQQEELEARRAAREHDLKIKNRRSMVKTGMSVASIVLLGLVAVVASLVVLRPEAYSAAERQTAMGALFVDTLGLIVAVWRATMKESTLAADAVPSTNPRGKRS